MKKLTLAAVALCLALGGTAARAQDAGALLDLLVKKKLISDQEAEEVRAELVKESASTAAGKWKLSTPITEIEPLRRYTSPLRISRRPNHQQWSRGATRSRRGRKERLGGARPIAVSSSPGSPWNAG